MGAMKGHQNSRHLDLGAPGRTLKQVRESAGLTQPELARLMGLSTRWVAAQETAPAEPPTDRRVSEVVRLLDSLTQVVQPGAVRGWLAAPNPAFDGLKPIEVVERGEIDRLWQMVFYMESGVAS